MRVSKLFFLSFFFPTLFHLLCVAFCFFLSHLRQREEGHGRRVQGEDGVVELHLVRLPGVPLVVLALHGLGPVQRACDVAPKGKTDQGKAPRVLSLYSHRLVRVCRGRDRGVSRPRSTCRRAVGGVRCSACSPDKSRTYLPGVRLRARLLISVATRTLEKAVVH